MGGWVIFLFLTFLFIGAWMGKKVGAIIGIVLWLIMCGLMFLVIADTTSMLVAFLAILSTILSAIGSMAIFRVARKVGFLNRILQHDNEGAGCMTLTIVFGVLLYLSKQLILLLL